MKNKRKQIKIIVTEQYIGTKSATEIFASVILSDNKNNVWKSMDKNDTMESPTIPNLVVPNERSM